MNYKHLSIEECEKIQTMIWEKKSIRAIARELGRSHTTLSREIRRHNPEEIKRYTPRLAQIRAKERTKSRGRKDRLKNETVRTYVKEKLKMNWSPEQISGCIKSDTGFTISHEAIYQYVYSQVHRNGWGLLKPNHEDLRICLRRKRRRR